MLKASSLVLLVSALHGCHRNEANTPQEPTAQPTALAPQAAVQPSVAASEAPNGTGRTIGSAPSEAPAPRPVRDESVVVTGSLQPEIVKRFVRRSYGELAACRGATSGAMPKPFGRLEFHFTISAAGDIATLRVTKETLGNTTLVSCITAALKAISFPQANDGVGTNVLYNLILGPSPV